VDCRHELQSRTARCCRWTEWFRCRYRIHQTAADFVGWAGLDGSEHGSRRGVRSGGFRRGQYVVVGEGGTVITSPNGAAWSPNLVGDQVDFFGFAQSEQLLVAVGEDGTILTSPDGRVWTPRPSSTTRDLHAVHFANGLFVAVGKNGTILTSGDGLVWTQRPSGSASYLQRVAWAGGLWVSVGEGGDICTSSNGLAWMTVNTGPPFTDHEGIAYGNGVWVAAGGYFFNGYGKAHSTAYYSTDGAHWVLGSFDVGVRLRDVAFGAGRFLAAGNDGWIGASTNGGTWSIGGQLSFSNFRRARFAEGHFLLVGNDGTMLSTAVGTNWLHSSPSATNLFFDLSWTVNRSRTTQNLHDIFAAADGTFLALGNNGMILQSGQTRPQLTAIRRPNGALELRPEPGLAPAAALRLEAATDLLSWQIVTTNLTAPVTIPMTNYAGRFFRLAAP
jgi:hypothetical protein